MSQLVMYKRFTENLIEKTDFSFKLLSFHDFDNGKNKKITMKNRGNLYYPNEKATLWNPKDNDIEIQFHIGMSKVSYLFGDKGIADKEATLAVGLHVFSKDSRFQQYHYVADLQKNMETLDKAYRIFFKKGELTGSLFFESFLYIKHIPLVQDKKNYFSYIPGTVLSDNSLPIYELNVDGDEQIFPIHEFHERYGPMWQLKKYYSNPGENPFTSETLQLLLNREHELFEKIIDPKTKSFRYHLINIILEVMSLVTYDVVSNESINLEDSSTYDIDSIAAVVKYWVESYDIAAAMDTYPKVIDIRNQFQNNVEHSLVKLLETEDRND